MNPGMENFMIMKSLQFVRKRKINKEKKEKN